MANSSIVLSEFCKPELVIQQKEIYADTYYGIYIPEDLYTDSDSIQKIHTDKSSCLTVLKQFKDSRFKCFSSYSEALEFASNGPPELICNQKDKDVTPIAENSSLFKGPRPQELCKLRKAIEKHDLDFLEKCIKENPRFLVSSVDTPAILQEGARYNALHVAAKSNNAKACSRILSLVSDGSFFMRLYPNDSLDSSERRSMFLLDHYLNTSDKGWFETPLHFACKFGAIDCVKVLLSFSGCEQERKNKEGKTPLDIVCSRSKDQSETLRKDIIASFQDTSYVSVIRDEDNCIAPIISMPWSPNASIDAIDGAPFHGNPLSPTFKVGALAGPMSPQKAAIFSQRWRKKSPLIALAHKKNTNKDAFRILDIDKGLERVGRELATELDVEWSEYWEFLDDFVNLRSTEGLERLESYLHSKYLQVIAERNKEDSLMLTSRISSEWQQKLEDVSFDFSNITKNSASGNDSKRSNSTLGELCQELEALRLNMSMSPDFSTKRVLKYSMSPIEFDLQIENLDSFNNNSQSALDICPYNFSAQSAFVSSQRLASTLIDVAHSLEIDSLPDFSLSRSIRNKFKPEIANLRDVICKVSNLDANHNFNFSFIHPLLSNQIVSILIEELPPVDINLLLKIFNFLVSNFNFFEDFSSSEEDENCNPFTSEIDENGLMVHLNCVFKALIKSFGAAESSKVDFGENINIRIRGECNCVWMSSNVNIPDCGDIRLRPININKIELDSIEMSLSKDLSNKNTNSERYKRAHSFLHKILFNPETSKGDKSLKIDNEESLNKNVVKCLTFDDVDAPTNELCIPNVLNEKAESDHGSFDSFESAISSINTSGMVTPEESIPVYIYGAIPSKIDHDVMLTLAKQDIDERKYPNISQWLEIVSTHSLQIRETWGTPCNSYRSSSPLGNHTPINHIRNSLLSSTRLSGTHSPGKFLFPVMKSLIRGNSPF